VQAEESGCAVTCPHEVVEVVNWQWKVRLRFVCAYVELLLESAPRFAHLGLVGVSLFYVLTTL